MKGAITGDVWAKTIKPPNIIKTIRIGKSQNFFLILKKLKNSIIKDIIKIDFS